MSAFDIAGAVVWFVLSAGMFAGVIVRVQKNPKADEFGNVLIAFAFLGGFIFCIARLFGAHL